jgi:DNA-directed RNA polymerase subunit H (RpoH/RPB5)
MWKSVRCAAYITQDDQRETLQELGIDQHIGFDELPRLARSNLVMVRRAEIPGRTIEIGRALTRHSPRVACHQVVAHNIPRTQLAERRMVVFLVPPSARAP